MFKLTEGNRLLNLRSWILENDDGFELGNVSKQDGRRAFLFIIALLGADELRELADLLDSLTEKP